MMTAGKNGIKSCSPHDILFTTRLYLHSKLGIWASSATAPTVEREGETALHDPSKLVKCQKTRNLSPHPCFGDDAIANALVEFKKPSWKTLMLNSENVLCPYNNTGLDKIEVHCCTIMRNIDDKALFLVCSKGNFKCKKPPSTWTCKYLYIIW